MIRCSAAATSSGFQYNTGQPVLYSAMLLRRALRSLLNEIDPQSDDDALRRMVVVGHSQGGLLTKLVTINSGNRFWENITKEPFEKIEMAPETRELLREGMFFEPVRTVERVVFIATPHRGSFRASGFALNLIRRIVNLPGTLVTQFQGLLTSKTFAHLGMSQLPTSVDNMSPGNAFIRVLSESPIDPKITAHSIIAVLGDGPITGKTDAVVAYESALIDGVASELWFAPHIRRKGILRRLRKCVASSGSILKLKVGLVDETAPSVRSSIRPKQKRFF